MAQTQLIAEHGYPQETHHMTTGDWYILELHRIHSAGGQPVLPMHGLRASSPTWVLNGPKTGLGVSPASTHHFHARLLFINHFYSQRTIYQTWDLMIGWQILMRIPIRETMNTSRQMVNDMSERTPRFFAGMKWAYTICRPSAIMFRRKQMSRNCIISVIPKEWQHFSLWHTNVPNKMIKFCLWPH